MDSASGLSSSDACVSGGEYGYYSQMLPGNSGMFSFDEIFTRTNLFQDPFNRWARV